MIAIQRTLRSSLKHQVKNIRFRVALAALLLVLYSFVSIIQPMIADAGIAVWTPSVVSDISGGRDSVCAVADGRVYCWGRNNYGQLGTPDIASSSYSSVPLPVSTAGVLANRYVTKVEGGTLRTYCAIADGQPYCWGNNAYGMFGNGVKGTTSNVPVATTTSGVLANKTVTDLSVGDGHACVIAEGAGYCWGIGGSGRLGDGSAVERLNPVAVTGYTGTMTSITAGSAHTCGVISGAVYCWGGNTVYQLGNGTTTESRVPTPVDVSTNSALHGKTVVEVEAGSSTTCALATDSTIACWGEGLGGSLGNGTVGNATRPVAVAGAVVGKNIRSLYMQGSRACAIDDTGAGYCWGVATGDGNYTQRTTPVAISTVTTTLLYGKTLTRIGVGDSTQSCATTGTEVYCWGTNTYGYLGNNTTTTSYPPVRVKFNHSFDENSYRFYQNANSATPGAALTSANTAASLSGPNQAFRLRTGIKTYAAISSVASGANHTCALANNKVYCWGAGASGQLGNGGTASSMIPVEVTMSGVLANKLVTSIAAGGDTTCVIASGRPYCWGEGSNGQLGNSASADSSVPVAVTTSGSLNNKTTNTLAVGGNHVCTVAADGLPYCWGLGVSGQLGNSSNASSNAPVAVTAASPGSLTGRKVISITAGSDFTCAVADNKSAHCWGEGSNGQLGQNTGADSNYPVAVYATGALSGKTVSYISAGGNHACAISSDYLVFCWGGNANGQVGNGSTSAQLNAPAAVSTTGVLSGKTIKTVSTGTGFSCALASDDQPYCWGLGDNYRLGNGLTTSSNVPVAVNTSDGLSGQIAQKVESGADHTCVTTKSEQVYCWGGNSSGQIGNNTTADSNMPVSPLVSDNVPGARILANDTNTYKLQYAVKTAARCSIQTGFADVTATSAIAWNTNASVANGAAITTSSEDPVPTTTGVAQTYRSAEGTFTNSNVIDSSKMGLWDFSLRDNNSPVNTTYCFRMTYGNGDKIESYTQYPEITANVGVLGLAFVDSGGAEITNPSIALTNRSVSTSCQTSTGAFTNNNRRLRVTNSLTNSGWHVTLEPSGGSSSYWARSDSLAQYDFNDSSGCVDGTDADTIGGQLTVNPSSATVTPQSGCTATGISFGASSAFSEGLVNSINLFSGSSSSQVGCYWDISGINLSQAIPAGQPLGTYTINMTATVVSP